MVSVKQGGNKYYFLSLWYHSTWDWTPASGPLANTSLIRPMAQLIVIVVALISFNIIRNN